MGLRALMVDEDKAPAMAALRAKGVNFKNPHALFPTFTTANASAMATGHYLGDTGDFSNAIYAGYPVPAANNSITPFLEYDKVLGDIDARFGDYLDEETLLAAARSQDSALPPSASSVRRSFLITRIAAVSRRSSSMIERAGWSEYL